MPEEGSHVGVGVPVAGSGMVDVGVPVAGSGSGEGGISVGPTECVAVGVFAGFFDGVSARVGVSLAAGLLLLHWIATSVAVGYALALSGSLTLKASAYCASAPQASPEASNCLATLMVASTQRLVALLHDESDIFG